MNVTALSPFAKQPRRPISMQSLYDRVDELHARLDGHEVKLDTILEILRDERTRKSGSEASGNPGSP